MDDLKDNNFGNVAILTFHAEFLPAVNGEDHQIWNSTPLVFVKVEKEWKITHEHHSPLIIN